MKRNFVFGFSIFISMLCAFPGEAQITYDYVRGIGSANNDSGNGIAVDAAGNTFTTGTFIGNTVNVEFNPGGTSKTLTTSTVNPDFYIAKYNSLGVLAATSDAFKVGNTNIDQANKIYVDANGNVYLVGSIIANAFFEKTGTFSGYQNGNAGRAFVVKYDNNLVVQWSLAIGDAGVAFGAEAKDIAVDASGNVYVTGQFQSLSTVDFNKGPAAGGVGPGAEAGPYTAMPLTSNGSTDIFVAKYNSGGKCQWAVRAGGTSGDEGSSIDYDNAGNVYVTGSFVGQSIDFGSSKILSEVGGGATGDIFVAKYSSAGVLLDAFNIGNALADKSNGIAVEKSTGDFAITGYFMKDGIPIDFDPSVGGTANETGVTMKDMFVAKYTSALAYVWRQAVGSSLDDAGYDLKLSASNVFVTGSYSGSATNFGNAKTLTSAGGFDAFIAVYTFSTGTCLSASTLGGASDEEGLAIDYVNSKIYITGYNKGAGDYDVDATLGETTLSNIGAKDIFFGKYTDASCSFPVITSDPVSISRCQATAAAFSVTATGAVSYQWKKAGVDIPTETGTSYNIASVVVGDAANYTVAVTNACGTVTSAIAALTVSTPVVSNAGSAQDICNLTTATLAGSSPASGTGAWTTTSGTGIVTTSTSATSGVTGLTIGAASTFLWTVTNGACITTSSVTITSSLPVSSNAGTAQSVCNVTTATLAATVPSLGTGLWTTTAGTGSVTATGTANSGVTGLTVGAASTFQWAVTNGACVATSTVTITSSALIVSNAGVAQTLCNATTATLAGNNPSPGTGVWTKSMGAGAVTSSGMFNSGVTGLTVGASTTFMWTITNGACSSNTSVIINSSSPVTSNAGSAQSVCNSTTATLAATVPTVGTGLWTTTAGSGVVTTTGAANSGVTALTIGAASTFQWTVTNGACTANSSVTITSNLPVLSNAGSAQTICNSTTATMAATPASPGSGVWTTLSGTGTVTLGSNPVSGVTGLTVGAASTFRWTVVNGACISNSTVVITSSSPVTSNAGTAQSICNLTTATLAATVPSPGTGAWTTTAGTGIVTTSSSATSGVTGLTIGSASTFQWTVTNGACSANSTVTITSSSPVTANAGTAQTICNLTTTTLAATAPPLGTGLWSTSSGTGTAATVGSNTSGVTGLTVGSASTFQWTVTNGACSANSSVTITSSSIPTSNAGTAQSICNITTTNLAATPPTLGTGLWTTTSGTGTATTTGSNTSAVTGLTVGASSTFQWTVTNGACSASSSVTITSSSPVTANAGVAQGLCNVTTTTLAATAPPLGTGAWSTTSGTGVASTTASNTSAVTGLTIGGATTFLWTVTNGACNNGSSVTVTVSAPGVPNPGSNQLLCNATTTTLAASGTGTWSTFSGTGVATTTSSNTSAVTGLTVGASTVFEWTVSNGACSGSAQVTITSYAPVTANAGFAQSICNLTTATLNAATPVLGIGAWTTVSGSGVVTTAGNSNSGVTGLTIGAASTFQWTVTNGACIANSTVSITSSSPVTSSAGTAQNLCNATTASLAATTPGVGTGAWTKLSGTGTATTASSPISAVTGLTVGANTVFQWTVTNGACSANSSVTITSNAPVTANAGTAQTLCNTTTGTLAATNPTVGTGTWTTSSGTGVVTSVGTFNSGITGLTIGGSSTFLWTVINGACSANASVTVSSVTPIVFTTHPLTQAMCTGSPVTFSGVVTGGGTITYVWKKGVATVSNGGAVSGAMTADLNIAALTTTDAGAYTLEATNACGTVISNAATLTVSTSVLAITTQPISQALCSGSTVTFDVIATGTGVLTYQWKKEGSDLSDGATVTGSGTTSLVVTSLGVADAGNYTVAVTNTCGTISSNVAVLTLDAAVITTQPIDQVDCPGGTVTFSLVANGPSLGYQWQKNAADILNATSASLVLNNVSLSDVATYTCNVIACSNTITSSSATFQLDVCTNTLDGTATDEATLYPNPTRNELHIKAKGNDILKRIIIVNATGTLVYSAQDIESTSFDVSVSHLAQGLYTVIIETASGRSTKKLEVIN